jgi:shikimate kinase
MQNAGPSPNVLNTERAIRHLTLCSLMGGGKTTVSSIVANDLVWRLVDNDESLTRRTGVSAAEFSARNGLDALHRIEAEVLAVALATTVPAVITAASSTVTDSGARRLLKDRAFVVWLDADPAILAARMASGSHRPSLGEPGQSPEEAVAALRDEREGAFREVADLVIDTSRRTPTEVAREIGRALDLRAAHES